MLLIKGNKSQVTRHCPPNYYTTQISSEIWEIVEQHLANAEFSGNLWIFQTDQQKSVFKQNKLYSKSPFALSTTTLYCIKFLLNAAK